MRVHAGVFALQELAEQFVSAREFCVVDYYFAQVCGQFTDAAHQIFATHYGCNALRLKITPNQVCVGSVSRSVQRLHPCILTEWLNSVKHLIGGGFGVAAC